MSEPASEPNNTGAALVQPAAFWQAAREGRFVLPACGGCARVRAFPVFRCHVCGGTDQTWVDGPRAGRLYSWTTTSRVLHPRFSAVPFRVGLVRLEVEGQDAVLYVSAMPAEPADDELTVGQRVVLEFTVLPDGRRAPVFVPVFAAAGGGPTCR